MKTQQPDREAAVDVKLRTMLEEHDLQDADAAHRFKDEAEVVAFLKGFVTRPLTTLSAGALLQQVIACGTEVPMPVLPGSDVRGRRCSDQPLVLELTNGDNTLFLRCALPVGGPLEVIGWSTSLSRVKELDVSSH